jgi:hypothetical protein
VLDEDDLHLSWAADKGCSQRHTGHLKASNPYTDDHVILHHAGLRAIADAVNRTQGHIKGKDVSVQSVQHRPRAPPDIAAAAILIRERCQIILVGLHRGARSGCGNAVHASTHV